MLSDVIDTATANIAAIRAHDTDLAALELDIPSWQEGTLTYLAKRRETIQAALKDEQSRLATALHVRDAEDDDIAAQISAGRRRLNMTDVTTFNIAAVERQRRKLDEMERLLKMKVIERAMKEGNAYGWKDDDLGISGVGTADTEPRPEP